MDRCTIIDITVLSRAFAARVQRWGAPRNSIRAFAVFILFACAVRVNAQPNSVKNKVPEVTSPKNTVSKAGTANSGAQVSTKVIEMRPSVAASVLSENKAPQKVDPASKTVPLNPGEVLFTKTSAAAQVQTLDQPGERNVKRWSVPYEFSYHTAEGVVRTSKVIAKIPEGGMRPTDRGFSGQILVALEDVQDRAQTYALPQPAQFLVTSAEVKIQPQGVFAIGRTNDWKSVDLAALDPPPRFSVNIRCTAEHDEIPLEVATIRGIPKLRLDRSKIQGFGLE